MSFEVDEHGPTLRGVLSSSPVGRISTPGAVIGELIEKVVQADLGPKLRGQTSQPIPTMPVATPASKSNDHPRVLGELPDHAALIV